MLFHRLILRLKVRLRHALPQACADRAELGN
jgi:hypothetical protein